MNSHTVLLLNDTFKFRLRLSPRKKPIAISTSALTFAYVTTSSA